MSFGGGSGAFSFGNPANPAGTNQPAKPAGFSFGGAAPAANNTQQAPTSSSPAAGFSFGGGTGQTLGGGTAAPRPSGGAAGNAFSFGSGGSGNLFGGSAPAGSTTPAPKQAFSFGTPAAPVAAGGASTTPASAPPTNLFANFGKPAAPAGGSSSLFGQQPSTSKATENSAPASTTFSGFGAPQTRASGDTSGSMGGFTLGAAPSTSLTPSSGSTPAPAPATKPAGFSFNNTSSSSTSGFSFGGAKPANSDSTSAAAPPTASTATTPFSFGGSAPAAASSATTAPNTAAPLTQPAPATLFSGFKVDNKDKPASDAAATPAPTFAGFGNATNSATNSAPATGSLFAPPKSAAPAVSAASAAPAAPAPAGGLFAGFGKPAAASTENKAPTTAPATIGATTTAAPPPLATGQPSLSTAAAASLPAPSMLRGRNMEEIVNKWTQELENATAEFTRQAAEVAVWDGVLRRGGDEISRLIQSLQAAEERQSSIEQTLDYVEQQQADLTSLLDGYEAQVAELLHGATTNGINAYGGQGVTRSMETGAADAERERAYAMAESLNAQLDELSSNLSSMIVEVNNLSSSTAAARPQAEPDANALGPLRLGSKLHNSGADPVSQIVAILNAHLGSLKWIDESTNALREKVENLRRGQIGGEARSSRDRITSSPTIHRQEGNLSNSRNRQSSVASGGGGSGDTLRAGSVGPGYSRGASVGRNAGSGWSEATVATGGSNLGRSRGYGL